MTASTPQLKLKLKTWPWIVTGGLGVLALFGGLGTWAATTRISGAIVAQGTLGVESKVKTVQHLEGGIVGQIHVHNGDLVKSGQLLIRLDHTAIKASHTIVSNRLFELDASLSRLKAERDGSDGIQFPQNLLKHYSDPGVASMLKGQRSLFDVREKSRKGQVSILRQRILRLKEQIKGLQIQKTAKQEQAEIIAKSITKKRTAAQQQFISGDTMDRIRQQKSQLTGDMGDLLSRIAQAHGSIEEIEQQILQADKDFREKVLSEIRATQTQAAELREKKNALEQKLRRIDIRAPQNGRIHNMSIVTVGGVISPAKAVLQIIPENDDLIIEARIAPTDVDQVKIGQLAAVHLSAFDARTTPVLNGAVSKISAAQVIDNATKQAAFNIEITISKIERARLKDGQKMLPGMPAEIFIKTADRTPLNYFLKPLTDQIRRAFKEQ